MRLIVITNLHNPTSVLTPDSVLREIGDIARSVGALVLVDEVYLDAVYEGTPRTSFHIGPEFVVTSSLTKVYGVSGLRCGWILARPDLAWKMRRLNDLYGATAVFPANFSASLHSSSSTCFAKQAGASWKQIANCCAIFWRSSRPFLACQRTGAQRRLWRLSRSCGSNDVFLERLQAQFETSAAPGRFFEMPDHFRIGMGVNTEMFAEGLSRIGPRTCRRGGQLSVIVRLVACVLNCTPTHGHVSSGSFAKLRRLGRSIGPPRLNRKWERVPPAKRKPRRSGAEYWDCPYLRGQPITTTSRAIEKQQHDLICRRTARDTSPRIFRQCDLSALEGVEFQRLLHLAHERRAAASDF